ncbi:MAG: 3-methyl-2-oxobutanoate hydroxymethyltransferase [Candidatus Diapherotrites archaeon]|nr:3-methyl-2-oxobutanoate hydroxymethyltransferase [Candidatus Diapherotrites archaeon]
MHISEKFAEMKKSGEKISVLACYDHAFARLVDAKVDALLVGDSLNNVVYGEPKTSTVSMETMLRHSAAVARACKKSFVIGDMPFGSFTNSNLAGENAKKFSEAGCHCVKIEGFSDGIAKAIRDAGIPVIGHLGLTPQTAENFSVKGRNAEEAEKIMQDALCLEREGCFALVLECVPSGLAKKITNCLAIPTIGIGAGRHCDGQVLVLHDILGLLPDFQPKFVKRFDNLGGKISGAAEKFGNQVKSGKFPSKKYSY